MSVVIPCYNYGHFLPQAVASVLRQPGVELEIVIVDDCSTDDSAAVAEGLAARHPSVRVVRNPVNLRHIATYNVGLAQVTGDFVVLLSADDLLAPGALPRAVALLEAHPDVTLVYGRVSTFETMPVPPPVPARTWSTWCGVDWVARSCQTTGNLVVNPEAVLRRSVLDQFGGYDPAFPHAADMLLWLQAATLGDVGRVNGTQAYYRQHGTNMHMTDYAGVLIDMQERARLLDAFLGAGGHGSRLPRAHALRQAAHRTLAIEAMRYAVHELDAGGPNAESRTEALAGFACSTWPGIRRTSVWRGYEQRHAGGVAGWRTRAATTAFDMRWALRWQRHQRWGT